MLHQLWAVRMLKSHPQWLRPLLEGTHLERDWGRPRHQGSWALAYMAFVVSGRGDIEPWWASSADEVWTESGFALRPCYQTTWNRFTELESVSGAFDDVVSLLIGHARAHTNGAVGRDLHVDATEAETNARLIHDCGPGDGCRKRGRFGARMHSDEAQRIRHREAALPEPEDVDALNLGDGTELIDDDDLPYQRIKVGDCWYRSRDKTAGIRAYTHQNRVNRFWHGFYNVKAVDHFTGAPVSVRVFNASFQECKIYPEMMESAIEAIGDTTRSVVADRGLSTKAIYEWNTRRDIASVMPFREASRRPGRPDQEGFDRHGIPRCKKCGAASEFIRFSANPSPRIWFRCQDQTLPECSGEQTIACSHDWRSLLPIWRTSEVYLALRNSHSNYERVHAHWRSRYRVSAATHEMRPKRVGVGFQQLRASAALLVEWLRVLSREGWTGSARRNNARPKRDRAERSVTKLLRYRLVNGLLSPYGAKAAELGLGGLRPGEPPPGGPDVPF
jgi:hypothetical protein